MSDWRDNFCKRQKYVRQTMYCFHWRWSENKIESHVLLSRLETNISFWNGRRKALHRNVDLFVVSFSVQIINKIDLWRRTSADGFNLADKLMCLNVTRKKIRLTFIFLKVHEIKFECFFALFSKPFITFSLPDCHFKSAWDLTLHNSSHYLDMRSNFSSSVKRKQIFR